MLAAVFVLAGVDKVRRPHAAATAAMRFRMVAQATPGIGYALGWAELATAALLMFPSQAPALLGCLVAGLLRRESPYCPPLSYR